MALVKRRVVCRSRDRRLRFFVLFVLPVIKVLVHPFLVIGFSSSTCKNHKNGKEQAEENGRHGHGRIGRTNGTTEQDFVNVEERLSKQPVPSNGARTIGPPVFYIDLPGPVGDERDIPRGAGDRGVLLRDGHGVSIGVGSVRHQQDRIALSQRLAIETGLNPNGVTGFDLQLNCMHCTALCEDQFMHPHRFSDKLPISQTCGRRNQLANARIQIRCDVGCRRNVPVNIHGLDKQVKRFTGLHRHFLVVRCGQCMRTSRDDGKANRCKHTVCIDP